MNLRRSSTHVLLAISAFAVVACTESPTPSEPLKEGPSLSADRSAVAQDRLAALFPEVSSEVLSLPGTVFADHDEARGKLVFGVENANAIPGVERSLAARGLAANEYVVELAQPIVRVATLRDIIRPVQAGVQIHFGNYLCSLGFNADLGTERSFITASHCTNSQGGVEGTTYYQPLSTIDPTVIATEVSDPPYFSGGVCSRGKVCRYSDASRARYSDGTQSQRGVIASTTGVNNGSLEISGSLTVTAQDNTTTSFTGDVDKVGRTTGWTRGTVTNTCSTVNVSGSRIQLLCQTIVQNNAASIVGAGDSGSGMFKVTSGTNVTLVGILWGGSGSNTLVFSPLKNIQDELGQLVATSIGGGGGEPPPCVPKGKGKNCH